MSTIHPHWHSTDDAPVPVRIVSPKAPDAVHIGSARVSRSPAAILGIMLAVAIGAVSYGTLDDTKKELTGDITGNEVPTSAFDILARQIAEEALQDSIANGNSEAAPWAAMSNTQSVPERPATNNVSVQSPSAIIPTNTNTAALGAEFGSIHSAAPRPFSQPESGAGMILATLTGAFAMLLVIARNTLKIQA